MREKASLPDDSLRRMACASIPGATFTWEKCPGRTRAAGLIHHGKCAPCKSWPAKASQIADMTRYSATWLRPAYTGRWGGDSDGCSQEGDPMDGILVSIESKAGCAGKFGQGSLGDGQGSGGGGGG